mmetsp:Transcript_59902/g.113076  ORF Transcript_59902/g.113076 Transcript_59902/m.113076 type:complete len:93 (-) Transcript_59902:601-879(-)
MGLEGMSKRSTMGEFPEMSAPAKARRSTTGALSRGDAVLDQSAIDAALLEVALSPASEPAFEVCIECGSLPALRPPGVKVPWNLFLEGESER